MPIPASSATIICDVSTGVPRPYVPSKFKHTIFDSLHCIAHPGIRATQKLITSQYVWPSINKDVRQWAQSCLQCQKTKIHRHTITPLGTFSMPDARFDHVIASEDGAVGGSKESNAEIGASTNAGLSLSSDTISLVPLIFIVKCLGDLLITSYGPS